MHIPDGMLDAKTVVAGWGVTVPALGWALRVVRRRVTDGRLVLMSVLASLIFALQMLNFPVLGGTSGHFAGGALAAILLGPSAAIVVMFAVLAVQAFVFADGGIAALGANAVNMALVAPLVGWWAYSAAVRWRDTRGGRAAGAFVGGWSASLLSALGAAVMLWAAGVVPLLPVAGAMALWHALIGLGEGLVTASLVTYLHAVRPELLLPRDSVMGARGLAASLLAAAVGIAGLSFLASRLPDGLERVAADLGFLPAAGTVEAPWSALLPVGDDALAAVLAGIAGVLITAMLLFSGVRAVRRRAAGS